MAEAKPAVHQVGPMSAPAPKPDAAPRRLTGNRLMIREIKNNPDRVALIEQGIAPEDIDACGKFADFWNDVANDFVIGDRVQARWLDRTRIAEYVCIDADVGCVVMKLQHVTQSAVRGVPARAEPHPGYVIERTPEDFEATAGWQIRRLPTEKQPKGVVILNSGNSFRTEEDARRYCQDVYFRKEASKQRLPG